MVAAWTGPLAVCRRRQAAPCELVHLAHRQRSAWTSSALSFTRPPESVNIAGETVADPLRLVADELGSTLRENVKKLLGSNHPALDTVAKYYWHVRGKHIRPLVVLLMAQATNGLAPSFVERTRIQPQTIDEPLEPLDVLNDVNPDSFLPSSSSSPSPSPSSPLVLPTQRRLAEITEMIHVASLMHDDVVDASPMRRGAPSAPASYGNKLSILAGDFLLGRASVAMARLGSNEVVELVASVLANLVQGEVMQIKGNAPVDGGGDQQGPMSKERVWEYYMSKTYLKTASLIAKSARATVILGGCGVRQGWPPGEWVKDVAYAYGRNLGLAFQVHFSLVLPLAVFFFFAHTWVWGLQLIDDMLDYTTTESAFGKPSNGADLKLGLATAPALYAWERYEELGPLIARNFSQDGDVEQVRRDDTSLFPRIREMLNYPSTQARDLISRSDGTQRTYELASKHARLAREQLERLPESEARESLRQLTEQVLKRTR
jgi:hexaprenyl-diphosphate synthase